MRKPYGRRQHDRPRGSIYAQEILRSKTGRTLAPVPKFNTTSNAGVTRALRSVDAWLIAEAKKEAEAAKDRFVTGVVEAIDLKNMSPSDRDTLNDIIFGHQNGPGDEHRVA